MFLPRRKPICWGDIISVGRRSLSQFSRSLARNLYKVLSIVSLARILYKVLSIIHQVSRYFSGFGGTSLITPYLILSRRKEVFQKSKMKRRSKATKSQHLQESLAVMQSMLVN